MNKGERYSELERVLLNSEKPSEYFEELRERNELEPLFSELNALIGVPQNKLYHQEGDTWVHTMMVLDEAAKKRYIVENAYGFMLSALCHDFGKSITTTEIDGCVHAYKHEIEGLPLVGAFLERIGVDKNLQEYVLNMTEYHMQPNILAEAKSKIKRTNKLFDSSVEPFDLIQLSICDVLGKIPQCCNSEDFLMERYRIYLKTMSQPYVTRSDLINAGIPECDAIEEILGYTHKLRLAGCDKNSVLKQSVSYAKKVLKII